MAYVVLIVVLSVPISLSLAALKQIAEAQPRAATAPVRRRSRPADAGFEVRPRD
jgi:hypothetical protein